jgi:hypothetical protein
MLNAVQKVQVAETYVKAEVEVLETAIEAQIPLLPVDKQPAAIAQFNDLKSKVAQATLVKDAAIQAALDASQSTIDVGALMQDLINLIPLIINFAQTVGVDQQTIARVEVHYNLSKVSVAR